MRLSQVVKSIAKLADEIYNLQGKLPDRDIDKMMRELIDLNSLYTRLRRKKSKYRKPRVYSPAYRP